MTRPRSERLLASALVLLLSLAACGESDSGGSGARPDGGATPQEVVDGLMAAAQARDFGALVPYVLPEQRAALAYGIGVMPMTFMVGIAEAMLPAAQAVGGGEAEKAQARIAEMQGAHEALLQKYGIAEVDDGAMQATGGNEAAMMTLFNEAMGDIDHAAFLEDAVALMQKYSGKDGKGQQDPMKEFDKKLVNLKVTGDTATADIEGEEGQLGLVKVAGRWYADMKTLK